jgi:hypothetical protein
LILAHAYIVAELNDLNGADFGAAAAALMQQPFYSTPTHQKKSRIEGQ